MNNRCWSHSRQNLFDTCERAFYYQYAAWGDENADVVTFLRNVTSAEMLSGGIVHEMLALLLRQHQVGGTPPASLVDHGVRRYRQAIKRSDEALARLRKQTLPTGKTAILRQHLYGEEDRGRIEAGEASVAKCLDNFLTSPMWERLQKTNRKQWLRIATEIDEPVFFVASPKLGFKEAVGLRVYSAYDFALLIDKELHVIDWKTGAISKRADGSAAKQLGTYALWARSAGYELPAIRIQVSFLAPGKPEWSPQAVDQAALDAAVARVEQQVLKEKELFTEKPGTVRRRQTTVYDSKLESFKMASAGSTCARCKFAALCGRGDLAA